MSDDDNSSAEASIPLQLESEIPGFDDFNDLVEKMKTQHAEYNFHAEELLREMRHEEDYRVVDVVKEVAHDLRYTLVIVSLRIEKLMRLMLPCCG